MLLWGGLPWLSCQAPRLQEERWALQVQVAGGPVTNKKSKTWKLRHGQARAPLEGRQLRCSPGPPPSPPSLSPPPLPGDPAQPRRCVRSEVTPPPAWFRNEDRPVVSEGQDKSHTLGAFRTTQSPDLLGASLAPHPKSTNTPRPEDLRVGAG